MTTYKYSLEKYQPGGKNRYKCSLCGKDKVFVRYINNNAQEYIDSTVGKCNRIEKCGYHKTPYVYLGNSFWVLPHVPMQQAVKNPTLSITMKKRSLNRYKEMKIVICFNTLHFSFK